MKIVVDRRVFPMFKKSTYYLMGSFAPIIVYFFLFNGVFIRQVSVSGSASSVAWFLAYQAPFIAITIALVGSWFAMFFMGRNLRRDAVAIYLKKDSRKNMSAREYRNGIFEVRDVLRLYKKQS